MKTLNDLYLENTKAYSKIVSQVKDLVLHRSLQDLLEMCNNDLSEVLYDYNLEELLDYLSDIELSDFVKILGFKYHDPDAYIVEVNDYYYLVFR